MEGPQRLTNVNRENKTIQEHFSSPASAIIWADENFPSRVIATSSFQTQSMPLLYLIANAAPHIPVLFADTGFHFPETLEFRDQVVDLLGLRLIVAKPEKPGRQTARPTRTSSTEHINACCTANKLNTVSAVMKNYHAWISGIRHDQTEHREQASFISFSKFFEIYKIAPMLYWSHEDIMDFIEEHHLPRHPLWEKGYRSIGCQPCTLPVKNGEADRAGRWAWIEKMECGLQEF